MMSIQLIWKRLMTNEATLSFHRISTLPSLAFYAKPSIYFANFCTEISNPSTAPDRGVATEFFITKCGLTDSEITKAYRHCNSYLRAKSSIQNMEEILELLKGCGLTTPAQIRRVVLCNPHFFFSRAERNVKPKLSLLRTFMKKDDMAKLICWRAGIFTYSEDKLRSGISLLQKLGIKNEALSELLVRQPHLVTAPGEKVIRSFKLAEDLGFKKGSKMFALSLRAILGLGKESLNKKRQYMRSLGFSENQISDLWRKNPQLLSSREEKLKRNVDFVVNIVGLQLVDLVKYPSLFGYSVETRMYPRYRVVEALKSIHVQVPQKSIHVQVPQKKGVSFGKIVALTEKCFLEKYVNSNAEFSSLLLDIYHGRKESWKADH